RSAGRSTSDRRRRAASARGSPAIAAPESWFSAGSHALRPYRQRNDSSGAGSTGSGAASRSRGRIRRIAAVVLSDATIARYLADGRIEIDPYDASLLQPSS